MMKEFLVKLHLLHRLVTVGKVLHVSHKGVGKPVFYTEVREEDIVRMWDAVSIAPAVLDFLIEHGISEIHFWIRQERKLLVGTVQCIREHGRLASLHPGIGPRFHVERRWLEKRRRDYNVPWLNERTAVILHQEEPARQLSLWEVK